VERRPGVAGIGTDAAATVAAAGAAQAGHLHDDVGQTRQGAGAACRLGVAPWRGGAAATGRGRDSPAPGAAGGSRASSGRTSRHSRAARRPIRAVTLPGARLLSQSQDRRGWPAPARSAGRSGCSVKGALEEGGVSVVMGLSRGGCGWFAQQFAQNSDASVIVYARSLHDKAGGWGWARSRQASC
jgi:hypothetical protein